MGSRAYDSKFTAIIVLDEEGGDTAFFVHGFVKALPAVAWRTNWGCRKTMWGLL